MIATGESNRFGTAISEVRNAEEEEYNVNIVHFHQNTEYRSLSEFIGSDYGLFGYL